MLGKEEEEEGEGTRKGKKIDVGDAIWKRFLVWMCMKRCDVIPGKSAFKKQIPAKVLK